MSNRVNVDDQGFWDEIKNDVTNAICNSINPEFDNYESVLNDLKSQINDNNVRNSINQFGQSAEQTKSSINNKVKLQIDSIFDKIISVLKDNLVIDSDGGLKQTTNPPHFKIRKLSNQ